jgi:drug/metabolite transporter (DMT)-like permease
MFIKIGLEDLPPLTFAGIRFVIATIILSGLILARRIPLPRERGDWGLMAITGVLAFTINYGLLFWGEQYISSGLAALLQATIPVFGLVTAHYLVPGERMTMLKVGGVLLGLAGVAIIFSDQVSIEGASALWGSAAIVTGAVAVAFANVLIKTRGARISPAVMACGQMVFGMTPLLVIGIATEGNPVNFHWTARSVFSLLYLAVIGSSVAFLLYYWLVRRIEVTRTMLIALVTPLIAVTLGMLVLGERLNYRIVLGGAMILLGVGMIMRRAAAAKKSERAPRAKTGKEQTI